MSTGAAPTGWLGVDVGWVYPAVDSDGIMYRWPAQRSPFTAGTLNVPAGPVTIRQPNGEVIIQAALTPEEMAVRAADLRTRHRLSTVAASVVAAAQRDGRGVALEDWSAFQKRKPAWVNVYRAIAWRAENRDCPVIQVNRAWTSVTCPRCNRRTRANRKDRNTFACVDCGFVGQADHVAAINIARRAAGKFESHAGICSNPACEGRPAWRKGLCIWCYRFKWRKGQLPGPEDFAKRAEAPSVQTYRNEVRRAELARRAEERDAAIRQRMTDSYATHDAWGNPLPRQA